MEPKINFDILVSQIEYTNEALQNNARLVINRHVTAKAWLTGYYIVEYEQNGSDRAKYGDKLISELSKRLGKRNFSTTNLKIFRQFYLTYPSLLSEIGKFILSNTSIGQSLTDLLQLLENKRSEKRQSLTDLSMTITQSLIAQSDSIGQSLISQFQGVAPDKLFNRLSFTHLAAILPIKDPLQRAFYETMAIRGTWSVRELQRQIDSNYYVRSGWSQKPEALADLVDGKAEQQSLSLDIKSPYTFEFLGLQGKEVIEESDLETALIDNLQNFIQLLKQLSVALTEEFGKGFSVQNIYYFRQFYLTFPEIFHTPCGKFATPWRILTWSHYRRLLSVTNDDARNWYLREASEQMWSYATLNRNISTQYYERLLMSQQKDPVINEMKALTKDFDADKLEFVKNPMVTEFLGMSPNKAFVEEELETAILNNLQKFLLELGKGFSFVERHEVIGSRLCAVSIR